MEPLIIGELWQWRGKVDCVDFESKDAAGNLLCHTYPREELERLIQWGQDWLKENPKKVEGWLNVYANGSTSAVHPTKIEADIARHTQQIACIPISYHIGQGLNTGEDNE